MTQKIWEKINNYLQSVIWQKNEYISCVHLKTQRKWCKTKYYFNDSKPRRKALSCSKKLSALLLGTTSKYVGELFELSSVI